MTKTVVRCGQLIDGTGAGPRRGAVIALEGPRIAAIGGEELAAGATEIIDFSEKSVTPGLIDLHNHMCSDGDPQRVPDTDLNMALLRAARNLGRSLRAGVTTVRDAGSPRGHSYTAKAAVVAGIIEGPRCFISGIPISITGGHGWYMKRGADVLKLLATGGVGTPGEALGETQMTVEEMRAAVDVVHSKGKRVMAHAMGPVGVTWALEAGVDTIEHGVWFGDKEIDHMIRRGAWLVPTFSVNWVQSQYGKELGMPAHVIAKATQAAQEMFRCTEAARKAGVKIAMGTDAGGFGVAHGTVALELELMLKSGACATPLEVIQSATGRAADALGKLDELGTVEVGKFADLVALGADPLEDISAYRHIEAVVKDGRVVHRAA
jgi:imidazolonepropionase-like amidohydrolase